MLTHEVGDPQRGLDLDELYGTKAKGRGVFIQGFDRRAVPESVLDAGIWPPFVESQDEPGAPLSNVIYTMDDDFRTVLRGSGRVPYLITNGHGARLPQFDPLRGDARVYLAESSDPKLVDDRERHLALQLIVPRDP